MSSQSILMDSFKESGPRFGETASAGVDVLEPAEHMTIIAPAIPIKREIGSDNTVGFAKEVRFRFPSAGYCHHVAIKYEFAQTTTYEYVNYPAFEVVDEYEFKSDNETLHQYKADPVNQVYLASLKDEEAIDKVLIAAGATGQGTTAAFEAIAPVPMFFDPILSEGAAPINLAQFKKAPELIVKTKTLINSLDTNSATTDATGAITNMYMILYMSETSSSAKDDHLSQMNAFHMGVDFYTSTLNPATSGTPVYIDVSGIKGTTKKLFINARTTNDVGTVHDYMVNKEIDEIKTRLDGHEEYVFKTKEEGGLDYIVYNHGKGYSSTLGYNYIVPYGYFVAPDDNLSNVGGLHSAHVNKHEIKINVTNTGSPATHYIDVVGIRSAIYKYDNGSMIRLL